MIKALFAADALPQARQSATASRSGVRPKRREAGDVIEIGRVGVLRNPIEDEA